MLGHEDGVIAFGDDFAQTACTLINLLAKSKQLSQFVRCLGYSILLAAAISCLA
jgi:hypothetical protein